MSVNRARKYSGRMCYDQEKTQAPMNPNRADEYLRAEKQMHDRIREAMPPGAGGQTGRAYAPQSDADVLAQLFSYHPPTEVTLPKFAAINQAAKNFAEIVLQNCPPSADRSAAIRLIRDARMTANASVALNGLSL